MMDPADRPAETEGTPPQRLYLFEPGWRVALKIGSEREFCYMMAPGQDYYHRLYDGEIYLRRADEKICMACAARRGLIYHDPKGLREQIASFEFDAPADLPEIDLRPDWPG